MFVSNQHDSRFITGIYLFQTNMIIGQDSEWDYICIIPLLFQVLMKGNQAYGIEMKWNNTIRQVRAKKEVILSAGTIESPHLLMLSGIGPRRHLESLDVNISPLCNHYVFSLHTSS